LNWITRLDFRRFGLSNEKGQSIRCEATHLNDAVEGLSRVFLFTYPYLKWLIALSQSLSKFHSPASARLLSPRVGVPAHLFALRPALPGPTLVSLLTISLRCLNLFTYSLLTISKRNGHSRAPAFLICSLIIILHFYLFTRYQLETSEK